MITAKQIDEAKQKIINKILADISLSEIIVLIIEKAGHSAEYTLKNMSEEEILEMLKEKGSKTTPQKKPSRNTIRSSVKKAQAKSQKNKIEPSLLDRAKKYLKNLFDHEQEKTKGSRRKKRT